MKVFIPTAGIGSRLGSYTENLNKSLITVNNKPAISHIIELFPKKTHFIIALGFDGKKVKDFLKLAYPELIFTFVNVRIFIGPGSGLKHTLLCSEKFLKEPFIFISCDTIIKETPPKPDHNWIGYNNKILSKNYRKVRVNKKNQTLNFYEKDFYGGKGIKSYIGTAGIYDHKIFWQGMKKTKFNDGEISGLKNLTYKKISAYNFTWFDIGNIKSFLRTKSFFRKKNKYNILEKKNESIWFVKDKVIKFSSDISFIKNRIKRQRILKKYTPKIIGYSKNFYVYKKIEAKILSKIINKKLFIKLLQYLNYFWFDKKIISKNLKIFNKSCLSFYKDKTFSRVRDFLNKNKESDKIEIINNVKVNKINFLLKKIDWDNISQGVPVNFHGDLHFENILFKKKSFYLLDWRQDFNNSLIHGDLYYDLAKILHGIIISHENVQRNKYKITYLNNKKCFLHFKITKKYKIILYEFENWIKLNNYDLDKVRIITALIFINISPLHHNPYSVFLFKLGKLLLQDIEYFNKFSK